MSVCARKQNTLNVCVCKKAKYLKCLCVQESKIPKMSVCARKQNTLNVFVWKKAKYLKCLCVEESKIP